MLLPLSDVDDGGWWRWRWRRLPAVAIEPDSGSSPAWMTAWLLAGRGRKRSYC